MATLHKDARGRSPFWICQYRAADGRWLKKSTKESNRTKAMEICLALQRAESMARKGEATETRMRELLSEVMERTGSGSAGIRNYSVTEWLTAWLERKTSMLKGGSVWAYKKTVENFLETVGGRSKLALSAITAADVQKWVAAEVKRGRASASVRMRCKILRAAFHRAIQEGLLTPPNPAETVDLPKGKGRRKGLFTAVEIDMLIGAADGEWKTLVTVGAFTGARLGDCASLRWCDIDLAAGFLMFDVIKTEEFDHRIPIHPRLRDRLEEIATDDPNPKAFLMPSLAGKESRGAHGLSAGFMAVMHRAGVDPGEMQSGLRKMSRRSFHSLRHTAASTLLDAGVDTELVRAITGHADGKSFRRYLHPSDEALTQAVSKMRK